MKHTDTTRYLATGLDLALDAQGRRRDWLADQLGVTGSYITILAKGRRTVNRDTAERISKIMGTPMQWLFSVSDGRDTSTTGHDLEQTA